jgi:phosphatidylinositol phosphate synthase
MPAMEMEVLRARAKAALEPGVRPVARALMRAGVSPNQVSGAAVALNVVAAVLVLEGRLLAAGIVYLCAGALDLVDGAVARLSDRVSAGGAFLDSTLDRISEGVVFAAIAWRFATDGRPGAAALTVLALLGSLLVSYTRARAEALGSRCDVGVMTRAERVVLIAAGLAFGALALAIDALVVLSFVTVGQRIVHTMKELGADTSRRDA